MTVGVVSAVADSREDGPDAVDLDGVAEELIQAQPGIGSLLEEVEKAHLGRRQVIVSVTCLMDRSEPP